MKQIIPLILCITASFFSSGQEYASNIKRQADSMMAAFVKGDVERLLDFTYPPLFEFAGDREFMAEFIAQTIMAMQYDGFTIDTALVNTPGQIFKAGSELHALLTQTVYASFREGTVRNDSPLLAISQDGGNKWFFLDLKQFDAEMIRQLFPNFNYDLKLPPIPPPVITYRNGVIEK